MYIYQTTRCHTQEDRNLHMQSRKNFKSVIVIPFTFKNSDFQDV
jgi:hypothetical protein